MAETKDEKKKRLAEALRVNLRKRKDQKRADQPHDGETERRQFRNKPISPTKR